MKKLLSMLLVFAMCFAAITPMTAEASVKLSKITLTEGMSYTLNIDSSSKTITWTSSDTAIVTVAADGTVTAVKAGDATITAKAGKKKYTCMVAVNAAPKVTKPATTVNNNDAGNTPVPNGKKTEVLTVKVKIGGTYEVKGTAGEVSMIGFTATVDNEFFKGKTLPNCVDTQKEWYGSTRTVSARYILEGTDKNGKKCKLFVENNGTVKNGVFATQPKIITDCEDLKYLETATLVGTVSFDPDCLSIHIFKVE